MRTAVVHSGKDMLAELAVSSAGTGTMVLRRKGDNLAVTAPLLLSVVGGPVAGLGLVSATPALDKVAAAQPAVATVKAMDAFGNQLSKSAGAVTATTAFGASHHDVQVGRAPPASAVQGRGLRCLRLWDSSEP